MKTFGVAVASLLVIAVGVQALVEPPAGLYIPPAPEQCTDDVIGSISWGVASAAYQIEGGYNEGGKSASIWDTFVKLPGKIKGGGTGNVAIDHFHKYKQDYALMKDMGVNMHRFSILWPRLLPAGKAGSSVNPKGLKFYHNLIDEMIANGITPVATMYHWDLPQVLQDSYNGFLSEQIVEDFTYYASVLLENFGDKVKHWVTFNEPPSICDHGYKNGIYAPGVQGGKQAMFRCGHNVLLAHASAVKLYRQNYSHQGAKIGLTTNVVWPVPMSDSEADKRAAQNKLDREFGWIADPLFFGDYPASSKAALGADLPSFTQEQQTDLKGSVDFIGVNSYTARYVYAHPTNPLGFKETSVKDGKPIGEQGAADWLLAVPEALAGILTYTGQHYGKPETWVMEFGTGVTGETGWTGDQVLQDSYRTAFFSSYLNNACRAIKQHGLNVPKLFAWTIFDNFEWAEGYEVRYGLVHVDFATQQRRIKQSGYWWSKHFLTKSKTPS